MDEGLEQPGEQPLRLSHFLRAHGERILTHWEQAVRQLPQGRVLPEAALRDHIPPLLERLADALQGAEPDRPIFLSELPRLHALQRLDSGFDLGAVTQELSALRDIILRLWQAHAGGGTAPAVIAETRALNQAIDAVVSVSVTTYAQARERTLLALERISAAALGTEDLDAFLSQLLCRVLESTGSADLAVLLLLEKDRLVARAIAGEGVGEAPSFSVRVGEGFAGRVAAERRPLLIHSAESDPLELNPAVRRQRIRALYGIPLLHGERLIGVAKMGSRTAQDFSDDDKRLFQVMAQRATAIIVQQQLALERQRVLDALEEGEPFALLDADWRVVLVNKGQERISRRPREQTLGQVIWELWPEMKAPATKYWREYHRCMEQRVPVVFEDYLPSLGLWTEVSAYPARDGGVAVFFRDVTERKQAHEALRHSEEQYRLLFDSMNEGFAICEVVLDGEGRPQDYRHLLVNQAFTRLSGGRFTPEFARGKTARELAPDVEQYWIELFGRVALTGEPAAREDYVAALDRWFNTRAYSLGGGRFAYIYEDVTRAKRAERAMREANERLVDADRRKDELIGILSHDLRNPLGVVKLAAGALLKRDGLDERTLKGLVRIQDSTERCMQLIETLLDFTHARLGTGIPVRTEPVHLGQLVLRVVDEVQALYPERELRTECRGAGTVEADSLRVGQVLQNLIQNAVKYSSPGTPITVRVLCAPEGATVQVHNLGTPIPEGLLPRLFEPMLRGAQEEVRGERSLGLGLYIVDQIVRAHGGTIRVESGEGGTTVTVQLPRTQPARADV